MTRPDSAAKDLERVHRALNDAAVAWNGSRLDSIEETTRQLYISLKHLRSAGDAITEADAALARNSVVQLKERIAHLMRLVDSGAALYRRFEVGVSGASYSPGRSSSYGDPAAETAVEG